MSTKKQRTRMTIYRLVNLPSLECAIREKYRTNNDERLSCHGQNIKVGNRDAFLFEGTIESESAKWATTIAQWLVSILFLLYIRRDDHLFCYVRLFGKMDKECCVSIVKLGLPSALQNCIFPLISMVIARQVASFGDAAVAVQKVGSQIESVSWMISDGFSVAINQLCCTKLWCTQL